ncbi:heavy-metal-associated domain-containing protein [Mycolicibacterium hodleri]|nr:heavy metal-associated domain-containing protein [Mycolicibacterium hodleri]
MTNLDLREPLPLLETEDSSCGCCAPRTTSEPTAMTRATENEISTANAFLVTGMTCGHCVAAVTEEISAIPGVTDVTVDLRPGATSTLRVTSEHGVTRDQIAAALDEAGDYHLTTD